jgi:hypothetical protein
MKDQGRLRDDELMSWIKDEFRGLKSELTPEPRTAAWAGRCYTWSSWSIDPEIRKALDRMSAGVICHDVPFTRGELKELLTVLYPYSGPSKRMILNGVFEGNLVDYEPWVEDANIALAKLGELGGGSEFTPDQMITLGLEAKSQGKNLIFDIDPGREIWNQPIEAMADVIYRDSSTESTVGFGVRDFSPAPSDTQGIYRKLEKLEGALKAKSIIGNQELPGELCEVARALSEPCPTGRVLLSDQVDLLRKFEMKAVKQGYLNQATSTLERHALFIQYGVEGTFAKSKDELPLGNIF